MSNRVRWTLLVICTVAIFAITTHWWAEHVYWTACHEAGGYLDFSATNCVESRYPIQSIWDIPWKNIALIIVPPGFSAIAIAILVWRSWPRDKK